MRFIFIFVTVVVLCSTQIISFGDSWGVGGAAPLQRIIRSTFRNVTVRMMSIGGTTAEMFADKKELLPLAVTTTPGCKYVWLSIGGNDILRRHAARESTASILPKIDKWTRIMLDELYKKHPTIKVLIFGYDILNFHQKPTCENFARQLFQSRSLFEINSIIKVYNEMVSKLVTSYPHAKFVDIFGAMQRGANVPNAPDLMKPSPFNMIPDCIHPTDHGWSFIQQEAFNLYWKQELAQDL